MAKMTDSERFASKVAPANAGGCTLWKACLGADGYGQISVDNRVVKAHRYSWELANGTIPPGMCVCHHCDVRACVNPDHLFIGTKADNNADMAAKNRARGGGPKGSRHGMAKLTEASALEIFGATGTQQAIGERYGVSHTTVGRIKNGRKWMHAIQGCAA